MTHLQNPLEDVASVSFVALSQIRRAQRLGSILEGCIREEGQQEDLPGDLKCGVYCHVQAGCHH